MISKPLRLRLLSCASLSLALLAACGGDDASSAPTGDTGGAAGQGAGGQAGGGSGHGGTSGGHAGTAGSAGAKGGAAGSAGQGAGGQGASGKNQGGNAQAGQGGTGQGGQGQSGNGQAGQGQAGQGQAGQGQAGQGQAGQGQAGGGPGGAAGLAVGEWLGMNGFVNDPDEALAAGGVVREYHTWDWNQHYWDGSGEHHTGVSEMVFQGLVSTWNLDDFFLRMQKAGIDVFPAIQGTTTALSGTTDYPWPTAQGADHGAPASYADHGRMMFQFAARYGASQVADGQLTLAAGQPRLSGLGYVRYLENGNEPDNTYAYNLGGNAFPQTAAEFAAMSSADYDGHQGALGPGVGVKSADPQMKMVMAGLAGSAPSPSTASWVENVKSYLQGIKDWSDQNRGGSFPADVINVHYYCLDYNAGHGIDPETCGLEDTIRQARQVAAEAAPGKPFWVTEFGYDRVQGTSWNEAIPVGPYDAETVQAQWLIRGTLAILLAGADRFTMYMSRNAGDDGLFATSGLVDLDLSDQVLGKVKTRYAAHDYFAAFRSRLAAMHLDQEVPSGQAKVRIVRFVDGAGHHAYALWSPTKDGSTTPGYALDLGGAPAATQVTLAKGSPAGQEASLTVSGGKVSVDVSENPVLVLAP